MHHILNEILGYDKSFCMVDAAELPLLKIEPTTKMI
jgi:hypothetical protein